jgi:amino acid permease
MKAQGFDLTKNAYNNKWQPYVAYWGCGWTMFFILINGFAVFFGKFNVSNFFTACEFCTYNALHHAHTKATRRQYSNFPHFVCWIQDCEEDQGLETIGNGLRHCTTFPFLGNLRYSRLPL